MKKQALSILWDKTNVKYEKAQDRGDTKAERKLWKQLRILNEQIENL